MSFVAMEFTAWFLHKYALHGPFWFIHRDHHEVDPKKKIQRNDSFAIVFAIPSVCFIYSGVKYASQFYSGLGYGILAYGIVYFFVHEIIIHKRYGFFKTPKLTYFQWVSIRHRQHHSSLDKSKATDFGMLFLNQIKKKEQ